MQSEADVKSEGGEEWVGAAEALKSLLKKGSKKLPKSAEGSKKGSKKLPKSAEGSILPWFPKRNMSKEEERWQEASRASMVKAMAEAEDHYEEAKQRALQRQEVEYKEILQEAEQKARAMVHAALVNSQRKYKLIVQRTNEVLEKRDRVALRQQAEAVHAARREAIADTLARTEGEGGGADMDKVAQFEEYMHKVKEQAIAESGAAAARALCSGRVRAAFATVRARADGEIFAKQVASAHVEDQRRLLRAKEAIAFDRSKMCSLEARLASTQSECRDKVLELTNIAQLRKKQSLLIMQKAEALTNIVSNEKRQAAADAVEQARHVEQDLLKEIVQLKAAHAKALAESEAQGKERASQLVRVALERAQLEHVSMVQRLREDKERERRHAEHALIHKLGGGPAVLRALQEQNRGALVPAEAAAPLAARRAAVLQADMDDDLP